MILTGGLLLVAFVVLAAYLGGYRVKSQPAPAEPPAAAAAPAPAPQAVTAALPAPAAAPAPTCPSEPLAEALIAGDGQFMLNAALSGPVKDPAAFLAVAREAEQQGHVRDAEVALLAACHVAEKLAGAQSAPLADVKSLLGQHYAGLAMQEPSGGEREALLQRAATFHSESAAIYAAALGKNASKTRMAERRLAALQGPAADAQQMGAVTVMAPSTQAPDTSRLGAARSSLTDRPLRNESLAEVDTDLERLYAQARSVTRDPAGLQRRHQQALAQRSACRGDEQCLRSWYAQRRRQLFAEF